MTVDERNEKLYFLHNQLQSNLDTFDMEYDQGVAIRKRLEVRFHQAVVDAAAQFAREEGVAAEHLEAIIGRPLPRYTAIGAYEHIAVVGSGS